MGGVESKAQVSPPETPVYRKYSHLKELQDPRSPMNTGIVERTPILKKDDKVFLLDPRSPSCSLPRTPVFCIPEPGQNGQFFDENTKEINEEQSVAESLEEPEVDAGPKHVEQSEKTELQVEISPEKIEILPEITEKGYLITTSKPEAAKKRRRRKHGKKKNNENKVQSSKMGQSSKTGKATSLENQPPRSPLCSRNFRQENSPSVDLMVKRMSLNGKKRPISFPNLDGMGKENLAAAFSP